jgi:hypothetical protein
VSTTTDRPPTREELDEARDRVRHENSDQLFDAPSQLSFDLGAGRKDAPDFASLKITGDIGLVADLKRRQNVTVTVTDHLGEVIATRPATITGIAFKDKTDKYGTTTERVHTASLD